MDKTEHESPLVGIIVATAAILILCGGISGCMYGYPQYSVYASRMDGQAQLAEAQGSRQALVAQAQAEKEAAVLRADAASSRVAGWVDAARKGCADMGLINDTDCER